MTRREKIICPECEKPSSIDLTECGNLKDDGGHCTFNTHKYWESFTPKTHLFATLFFLAGFYFFQFHSDLPTVPISSESIPIIHYLTMAVHYLPFGVLAIALFFLWKTIKHFRNRPPRL